MPSVIEQVSAISALAGQTAPKEMLVDLAQLERDFYARRPDLDDPNQFVSFGTSGQRGCSLRGTFTRAYTLAITQAVCDYGRTGGANCPLHIGKDMEAAS